MTQANRAAFKSKTALLLDMLHLTDLEVVALGLAQATVRAMAAGLNRDQMHRALDILLDAEKPPASGTAVVSDTLRRHVALDRVLNGDLDGEAGQ